MRCLPLLSGLPLIALASPALAQSRPPATSAAARAAADAAADANDEIVVTGQKPPGSVIGDIPAEVTLSPADVRAYGVSSISDLLDQLAPQTQSDRGRGGAPVVLLNGKRISGFGEIRDLPTEAILRVEILPEEVALKYGYTADQRVVNFVLRRRFRALTGEAGASTSTDGGGKGASGEAVATRIQNDTRVNFDLRYTGSERLRESQRDLTSIAGGQLYDRVGNVTAPGGVAEIDPALSALAGRSVTLAGVPASAATGRPSLADFARSANAANATDIAPYRTLRPATGQINGNAVIAHPIGQVSATLNTSFQVNRSESLSGLPTALLNLPAGDPFSPFARPVSVYRYADGDALRQNTDGVSGHAGLSFNGQIKAWRWSLTGNYDHGETRTRNETGVDASAIQARLNALDAATNPFANILGGPLLVDHARSISNSGNVNLVVNGTLATLPAGPIQTTLRIGGEITSLDSRSTRSGVIQLTDLSRREGNAQISVDVPIASKKRDVLPWLGTLSINGNAQIRQLSDFGTLRTLGAGIHWAPVPKLSLIVSITDDQGPPTVQQLGNPLIVTPQVRQYDPLRGVTVDISRIDGGNPALTSDDRRTVKLGATWKPSDKRDLTLSANYLSNRTRNAIATLPDATADLEAAFPDRFIRDAGGTLIRIDARPVNFQRESRNELRLGVDLSVPLKSILQHKIEAYRAARQRGENPPPPFPIPPGGFRGGPGGQGGQSDQGGGGFFGGGGSSGDARPGGNGGAPPPVGPDGSAPPPGSGGGFGGPPGGGGGGFGGGAGGGGAFRGGGRGGGQGGGRLQLAIYDTIVFRDDIVIRDGVPPIDLLDGGSVGAGGGQSRNQLQVQLGYSNNGLGARLSGNYSSATHVDGLGTSTTGDLRFGALATADLRLFADLGQMPAFLGKKWARGTRLTLSITNLTDSRQRVRDATGATPLRYQAAYLDPLGRSVRVTLRKLLF